LSSSNVVVRGGDRTDWAVFHSLHEQEFGVSISITKAVSWDQEAAKARTETGSAELSDIEVRHGGHAALDRHASLEFYGIGATQSYVRRCAFHMSYNSAIYVSGTSGLSISDTAAYYTLGSTLGS